MRQALPILVALLMTSIGWASEKNTAQLTDHLYRAALSYDDQKKAEHIARAKLYVQAGADVNAVSPRYQGKNAYTHFKNMPVLAEIIGAEGSEYSEPVAEMWEDLALLLIDRGASLDSPFGNKYWRKSPFAYAVQEGNPSIVQAMLERNKRLAKNQYPVYGEDHPILYFALTARPNYRRPKEVRKVNHQSVLKLLVAAGASVHDSVPNPKPKLDERKEVSLVTYFAAMGMPEAVQFLVQNGARFSKADVEFIRAVDRDCKDRFGTAPPFKSGVPYYCEKVKERQKMLALAEEMVAGTKPGTPSSKTH